MSGVKPITRFLALAALALVSSCIDSREEYWIRPDGGGRAEITCHLPAAAASLHGGEPGIRAMLGSFLENTPEISSSSYEVVTVGDRVRVKIDAAFGSALALEDLLAGPSIKALPTAASHLAGDVTVSLRGRTLDFSRKISASRALPGAVFLPASKFEGHRLTYIMHLPAVPADSNATRTENGGRTLVWDVPLAQAIRSPLVTRFTLQVPIPWKLVSAIVVPLLLACGFLLLRFRKSHDHPERPGSDFPVERLD